LSELKDLNEKGIAAMRSRDWNIASQYFIKSLEKDEGQAHVNYMLGQCFRFLSDYPRAIEKLSLATQMENGHKEWFLALGIALQLNEQLEESLDALRKANILDKDYDLAYNSAAITFRKLGDFEKATSVYDMCAEAIIRKFLFTARNIREQQPSVFFETSTSIYVDYTLKAMLEHSARTGIKKVIFPTEELAAAEYKEQKYGGLLWVDDETSEGSRRLYLPNCFDNVRSMLASSQLYYMCLENKSQALHELGEDSLARECLREASIFRRFFERSG